MNAFQNSNGHYTVMNYNINSVILVLMINNCPNDEKQIHQVCWSKVIVEKAHESKLSNYIKFERRKHMSQNQTG